MTALPLLIAALLAQDPAPPVTPPPAPSPSASPSPSEAPALVDNDEFAAWTKFKPGSTVRYKVTGQQEGAEIKASFKGLKKENAQIDQEYIFTATDTKQTTSVPRSIPPKVKKGETPEGHKRIVVKEGTETIAVAGRKLKCKYLELRIEYKGGGADRWRSEKLWISGDVVGGVARKEVKEATESTTVIWEAVEWKAK